MVGTQEDLDSGFLEGISRGQLIYNTLAHFVQCLETGQRFETEARGHLEKTFAAVEAAYASMESKRQVAIAEIVGCRSGASE